MRKRQIAVIAVLGVLAVAQASFAPHFELFLSGWFEWVNFVNIAVVVTALFERRRNKFGWLAAFCGGFFLDLYSGRFFGFWMIFILALVALIKFVVKKYVRIPSYW
jgi:hypothetical protein